MPLFTPTVCVVGGHTMRKPTRGTPLFPHATTPTRDGTTDLLVGNLYEALFSFSRTSDT